MEKDSLSVFIESDRRRHTGPTPFRIPNPAFRIGLVRVGYPRSDLRRCVPGVKAASHTSGPSGNQMCAGGPVAAKQDMQILVLIGPYDRPVVVVAACRPEGDYVGKFPGEKIITDSHRSRLFRACLPWTKMRILADSDRHYNAERHLRSGTTRSIHMGRPIGKRRYLLEVFARGGRRFTAAENLIS